MFAQESVMENPEKIEIAGLKTIHKLCKFGADNNMEGCTFTEIVERMFDELAKAQAVPEGFVLVQKDLVQSIHQSCVNSLIAESMPAFKAVANTIIDELSPLVRVIQAEAQEQSHE